jgi:hypothetical protein
MAAPAAPLAYSVGCVLFNLSPTKLITKADSWVNESSEPNKKYDVIVCAFLSAYLKYSRSATSATGETTAETYLLWLVRYFTNHPLPDITLAELVNKTEILHPLPFNQDAARHTYLYMVYLYYVRRNQDEERQLFKAVSEENLQNVFHGALTRALAVHLVARFGNPKQLPESFIKSEFTTVLDDAIGGDGVAATAHKTLMQQYEIFKHPDTLTMRVRNEFPTGVEFHNKDKGADTRKRSETEMDPPARPPGPNDCCDKLLGKLDEILQTLKNIPAAIQNIPAPVVTVEAPVVNVKAADGKNLVPYLEAIKKAIDDCCDKKKKKVGDGKRPPDTPDPPVRKPDSSEDDGGDDDDDDDDSSTGGGDMCFIDTPTSEHSSEFRKAWESMIAKPRWEEHLLKRGSITPVIINAMKTSYADIIEAKHNLPCPAGFTRMLQGVVVGGRPAGASTAPTTTTPARKKVGQRRMPASHTEEEPEIEDWAEAMALEADAKRRQSLLHTLPGPGRSVSFQGPKPGPSMSALAIQGAIAALAAAGGVALSPAGAVIVNALTSAP